MKILVTGATGTVGGSLVNRLLQRRADVSVLVRDPNKKIFPSEVKKVKGDLSNAGTWKTTLAEVDALFLLLTPDGDPDVIHFAENAGVKRVVALSDGTKYSTEGDLYRSNLNWTMLFPLEFMKNTLIFWQKSIREQLTARTAFPESKGALIHEDDIAEVAEIVLYEQGHEGKSYFLTGPEVITPKMRIEAIAEAIKKPIRMIVHSEGEARAEYLQMGLPLDLVNYAIESQKNPEPYMYTVQPTVLELTGHPPRPFSQWAQEHINDFLSS